MSLHTLHPEHVDETRMHAYSTFGPLLIHALVQKLAHRQGMRELDKVEQSLVRLVEETDVAAPHAEAMKESIRLDLLEPEQYERWPVQFGDMVRARRPSAAVRPIHQLRRGVHVRCLFLPCCCVCAPRPSSRR